MSPPYPIVAVDPREQLWVEQMGSKQKFWFRAEDGRMWLFKRGRERTGEDWAEKVAGEVAGLLGLPHARVELADCAGTRGCASLGFAEHGALVHGNELLWELDPSYPKGQLWRVTAHTPDNVLRVLARPGVEAPPGCGGASAAEVFVGYLLLDALIGNVDRHHENWALIRDGERPGGAARVALAPTYDHASSLGRELTDARRRAALAARDPAAGVRAYARRARSALYPGADAPRPLSTVEAFLRAAAIVPHARERWLARAFALTIADLRRIIDLVPEDRMSLEARDFALELLLVNLSALRDPA